MAHGPASSSKPRRARWAFAIHNLVGHPLMELAHLAGADRLAQAIHSLTLPEDLRDAGRLMLEVEAGEYFGPQSEWLSRREIEAATELYWDRVKAKHPAIPAAPVAPAPAQPASGAETEGT